MFVPQLSLRLRLRLRWIPHVPIFDGFIKPIVVSFLLFGHMRPWSPSASMSAFSFRVELVLVVSGAFSINESRAVAFRGVVEPSWGIRAGFLVLWQVAKN